MHFLSLLFLPPSKLMSITDRNLIYDISCYLRQRKTEIRAINSRIPMPAAEIGSAADKVPPCFGPSCISWTVLFLCFPQFFDPKTYFGSDQRWANSVLTTEYEYEYYSVSQKWPNTNTNIIRFPKNDRIQIGILFGFPKTTKYEYEYYSATQKWPNTNIIQLPNNDCFSKMIKFY